MAVSYTPRQAQFLAFIHDYTRLHGQPPSEMDMQRHFRTTPPSVHQMVITLEKRGLIQRTPGQARSIRVLVPAGHFQKEDSTTRRGEATPASILGYWRITRMDAWDQDFVDAQVEGYVRLDPGGSGEFQFGYVHGWIHHETTEREGKPAAEWSWNGNDEMDPASGRGWAVLQDDGTLKGKLAIHNGDHSGFMAVRKKAPQRPAGMRSQVISLKKHRRPGKP